MHPQAFFLDWENVGFGFECRVFFRQPCSEIWEPPKTCVKRTCFKACQEPPKTCVKRTCFKACQEPPETRVKHTCFWDCQEPPETRVKHTCFWDCQEPPETRVKHTCFWDLQEPPKTYVKRTCSDRARDHISPAIFGDASFLGTWALLYGTGAL